MTIQAGEYKSKVGLDQLYVAAVTVDTAAAYTAGTPEWFAPAAEASQEPVGSFAIQYADNQPYDVMTAEGETKITLTVTNIPLELLARITGRVYDATTGRMYDNGGTAPDYALGFRAKKSNGSYRYFWFLKGKFTMPKEELMTQGEKPEPKTLQIEFTAIRTVHEFDLGDINDTVKRVVGDSDATNFSATGWFTTVQVPAVAAVSALTLDSSTPAAGASGVSKTAAFTLTFDNALNADAINGINLLDATPALVTTTATLDATGKIMTITHTALAGTTAHTLVYSVVDIYGQVLNGILKFTTAA